MAKTARVQVNSINCFVLQLSLRSQLACATCQLLAAVRLFGDLALRWPFSLAAVEDSINKFPPGAPTAQKRRRP